MDLEKEKSFTFLSVPNTPILHYSSIPIGGNPLSSLSAVSGAGT
jgi:hypothetical protein